MTVRLRDCAPVPHDLVHVDQPALTIVSLPGALCPDGSWKLLTTQCTGHGPWLHVCVSAVCGHALPPKRGCVTLRLRDW